MKLEEMLPPEILSICLKVSFHLMLLIYKFLFFSLSVISPFVIMMLKIASISPDHGKTVQHPEMVSSVGRSSMTASVTFSVTRKSACMTGLTVCSTLVHVIRITIASAV